MDSTGNLSTEEYMPDLSNLNLSNFASEPFAHDPSQTIALTPNSDPESLQNSDQQQQQQQQHRHHQAQHRQQHRQRSQQDELKMDSLGMPLMSPSAMLNTCTNVSLMNSTPTLNGKSHRLSPPSSEDDKSVLVPAPMPHSSAFSAIPGAQTLSSISVLASSAAAPTSVNSIIPNSFIEDPYQMNPWLQFRHSHVSGNGNTFGLDSVTPLDLRDASAAAAVAALDQSWKSRGTEYLDSQNPNGAYPMNGMNGMHNRLRNSTLNPNF